jgi:predicted HTH transcriptional regulator
MTRQEFKNLLSEILGLGHELRGIECKGPGSRLDKLFLAKVIRAMLGMANRRDGGRILIGVEDTGQQLVPQGLSDSDLATWIYDDLSDSVAVYADPSVSFEVESHEDDQNRKYVLITVMEFESIPILCKRDLQPTLRSGACYVRSRRKPETTEVPTQEDMRDLLELATEKGIRKYLRQSAAVGLNIMVPTPPSDQELFDKQLIDLP